jgi:hypothetical protein
VGKVLDHVTIGPLKCFEFPKNIVIIVIEMIVIILTSTNNVTVYDYRYDLGNAIISAFVLIVR